MTIPNKFQTAQPVSVSYDYTDIEDGSGVVKYYGFLASGSVLASHSLTRSIIPSFPRFSTATAANQFDLDFDLSYNLPRIVRGRAIVVVPYMWTADVNGTNYVNVIFKKVSTAGAETTIALASGCKMVNTSEQDSREYLNVIPIQLPLTRFGAGETLRLNITTTGKPSRTDYIGHDPTGQAIAKNPISGAILNNSIFEAHIPYRVEAIQ